MAMRRRAELWRRDPRPGFFALAFGVATVVFAGLTAAVLLHGPLVALDVRVSDWIRSWPSPALETFFKLITHLGDALSITIMTTVLVIALLARKRPAQALLAAVTVGIGHLIGALLRALIQRPRPPIDVAKVTQPTTFSFPSGHATATFLFFGVLFFVVALEAKRNSTRAWTLAGCVLLAVLVGLSRIYLGMHWFGDVIGAWVLGAAWGTLCAAVYFALSPADRPA